MFMNIFIALLLIYILGNFIFYIGSTYHYTILSTMIRKGLYTLFIAGLFLGVMLGQVDYTDWKFILELAAAIVFIDLSVFQTPNILKIWSAEFQYANEIEDNIKSNKDRIQFMNRKSAVFSTIVQEAEEDLAIGHPTASRKEYKNQLLGFIKKYTDTFGFSIRLDFLSSDMEPTVETDGEIAQILHNMENLFNINILDKQDVMESLLDAQSFVTADERQALIPIYEGDNNFLIIVSANEGNIIEIDLFNIINLVTLFDWRVGVGEPCYNGMEEKEGQE